MLYQYKNLVEALQIHLDKNIQLEQYNQNQNVMARLHYIQDSVFKREIPLKLKQK